MRVSIYVPRPSSTLVSNLLGVLGLVAIIVAVGLLAGWPWALLLAGVIAVGLCALAQNTAVAVEQGAVGRSVAPLKAVS